MYRYIVHESIELEPTEAIGGEFRDKRIILAPTRRLTADHLVCCPTPGPLKHGFKGPYIKSLFNKYPQVDAALHRLMGRENHALNCFRIAFYDAKSKLCYLSPSGLSRPRVLQELHVIQYDKPWNSCLIGCLQNVPYTGSVTKLDVYDLYLQTQKLDFSACTSLYDVLLWKHVSDYQVVVV